MKSRLWFIKVIIIVVLGTLLWTMVRDPFSRLALGEAATGLWVARGDVLADTIVGKNGFRQITYELNGKQVVVTDEGYTHGHPATSGEYLAWMGQVGSTWQIFLHHLPSSQTIQLTHGRSNVNPAVKDELVAWEGQVDGTWQVFIFDGLRIRQVTDNKQSSVDVEIEGNAVRYARAEAGTRGLQTHVYQVSSDAVTRVTPQDIVAELAR